MSRSRSNRPAARREHEAASTRRSKFRSIEAGLWAVVGLLFVWRVAPQARAAFGWSASGNAAPAVTLSLLDGRPQPLADLKGRVVLVNFWATWCPPCRAEMPGFQKIYDATRSAGFTVLGISMDDKSPAEVASFLHDRGLTYPVAMATEQAVAAFGGINDYPTSFLIDRRGRIRYTVRGIFAPVTLRMAVDRLLAESD